MVGKSGAVVCRWACQSRETDALQAFVDSAVDDADAGRPLDFKRLYAFNPEHVAMRLVRLEEQRALADSE